MLHSPFFNFDSHGSFAGVMSGAGRSGGGSRATMAEEEDEEESDRSSSSCSSCNSNTEQANNAPQLPQKPTQLSSKKMNEDCYEALKRSIDLYVVQADASLRSKTF